MSLKQETREGQSKGDVLRTLLCHDTQNQHSKILTILQVNENKNKLLELIDDCDPEQCNKPTVITTKGEKIVSNTLREKCPNTEIFLVRIFPYSVRMWENTDQKKLRIWTLFTQHRSIIDIQN